MSSVLPGFEYDIFISYRQKDNKGDGWVTEFVEALKMELEATFKEDISVYFDINPHDGLLETHDVAASLKEKLKALIFIPIVSRTYCDPNSYAWEHEFIAFIAQAYQDRFGLKVKLPGGNVASRVLPVRIHDLEPEDIKLAESYLGFIRPVDFIYHSQGVNRPLRLKDDDLAKPGQQLVYRDQINKVANAVREIINGLKMGGAAPASVEEVKITADDEPLAEGSSVGKGEEGQEREKKPASGLRRKRVLWAIPLLVMISIAALLIIPGLFKHDPLKKLEESGRISIAVMPFQDLSTEGSANNHQDIVQVLLINRLRQCHDSLKVWGTENITPLIQDRGTGENKSITQEMIDKVSQKLGTDVIITGSIVPSGNSLRIIANLNYSGSAWETKTFQAPENVSGIISAVDSLAMMIGNYLVVDILRKELQPDFKTIPSNISPEALQYFIDGNKFLYQYEWFEASELYSRALEKDSNFVMADIGRTFTWFRYSFEPGQRNYRLKAEESCQRLYKKRDQMSRRDLAWINWLHADIFDNYQKQIDELRILLTIEDQSAVLHYQLGETFRLIKEDKLAIPELEKAIELSKNWGPEYQMLGFYYVLGDAYHATNQLDKEKKILEQGLQAFPGYENFLWRQARLLLAEGDTAGSMNTLDRYASAITRDIPPNASKLNFLAFSYLRIGNYEKAEKYFQKSIEVKPDDAGTLNQFAWHLIKTGRDLEKGLELADKALKISPDDYVILDTRGWGLYRQGKFEQAMEVMRRSVQMIPENPGKETANNVREHLRLVEKAIDSLKMK